MTARALAIAIVTAALAFAFVAAQSASIGACQPDLGTCEASR